MSHVTANIQSCNDALGGLMINTHTERERERERETWTERECVRLCVCVCVCVCVLREVFVGCFMRNNNTI